MTIDSNAAKKFMDLCYDLKILYLRCPKTQRELKSLLLLDTCILVLFRPILDKISTTSVCVLSSFARKTYSPVFAIITGFFSVPRTFLSMNDWRHVLLHIDFFRYVLSFLNFKFIDGGSAGDCIRDERKEVDDSPLELFCRLPNSQ